MARRKDKADDPIMWEVDEDGNEIGAEPVEAAQKKGNDKSKDLLKSMSSSSEGATNCAMCASPATSTCSKCSSVRYCGRECQARHWKAQRNSSNPVAQDGAGGRSAAAKEEEGATEALGEKYVREVGMLKGAEAKRTPAEPSKSLILTGAEATHELISVRSKSLEASKNTEQRPEAIHSKVAGDLVAKTSVVPELVTTAKGQEGVGFGKWGRDGYSKDSSGDTACLLRPVDPHRRDTLGGQATYSVRLEANKLLMEQQLAVVTVKTFEAAQGALKYYEYTDPSQSAVRCHGDDMTYRDVSGIGPDPSEERNRRSARILGRRNQ